ncbi:uncharacterized protein LOC144068062 isoform X2 [Stigmatopora argus]
MVGNSGERWTVVTVALLTSLSLFAFLCLRCKRKSKTIHEEPQIYNPHTFQREGSRFAVMRSKTVTRANQIAPSSNEDTFAAEYSVPASPIRSWEPIYVHPLPITVYENDNVTPLMIKGRDPATAHYANVGVVAEKNNDDANDYENSAFLAQQAQEQDSDLLYQNERGHFLWNKHCHLVVKP